MIEIDGSYGEGGGQILRTALCLSAVTGKEFMINNIRQGKQNPGLKAEHLSCIKALKDLCNAEVEGDVIESKQLFFRPKSLQQRELNIDIGTAGSITLVLQSLAIPIILTNSKALITGGTDVMWSPSIDYFKNVIAPALNPLGKLDVALVRRGYFNKGGGIVEVKGERKEPESSIKQEIIITERIGKPMLFGVSHAAKPLASARVAERQADSAKKLFPNADIKTEYSNSLCLGSGISIFAKYDNCILGADNVGEKGIVAEKIGLLAAEKLKGEIDSNAPVDEHLADNLIPLLGICGGEIKASRISNHCLTNIYVAEKFLDVKFEVTKDKVVRAIKQKNQ